MKAGSPVRPLCVAFIGAGNVLPAYLQILDRLVARGLAVEGPIFARRAEAREQLAARRPAAKPVSRIEDVLDSSADIVVLVTPPHPRVELAGRALRAGKHVLCEKPLGTSRAEAEPLLAVAREVDRELYVAPFVHLSPPFRSLWTLVHSGALGFVHSARALYGNFGAPWAAWVHTGGITPLADLGIYNLKSLTLLLGPVERVLAAEATAVPRRHAGGMDIDRPDSDVMHVILRHDSGALSSVVASYAIRNYRRPAIELYGDGGTANLLGDDWDPAGYEIWRPAENRWEFYEAPDRTWLWTDGLHELVTALRAGRAPLGGPEVDLHLLEVVESARLAASSGRQQSVSSRPVIPDLGLREAGPPHGHDRTRPLEEQ